MSTATELERWYAEKLARCSWQYDALQADYDELVRVLAALDGSIAWVAEHYPAAIEAMPTDLYDAIRQAGLALALAEKGERL